MRHYRVLLKLGTWDRPEPDGIAITDVISVLPLTINNSDAMCIDVI